MDLEPSPRRRRLLLFYSMVVGCRRGGMVVL